MNEHATIVGTTMHVLRQIERPLLWLGVLCVAIFLAAYVDRRVSSREETGRFQEFQRKGQMLNVARFGHQSSTANFSLWSARRIAEYSDSLSQRAGTPLAVLRITKVGLEVPVLEGTSELVLNRAVGHIPGTDGPGQQGNIGIAGHRDGFFRALKDVEAGDLIELESLDRTDSYRVDQAVIVSPSDTSVLKRRANPSLTLVTCYPFYFIGSAPKRYILQASIVSSATAQTVAQQHVPSSSSFRVQSDLSPKSQKAIKEITK